MGHAVPTLPGRRMAGFRSPRRRMRWALTVALAALAASADPASASAPRQGIYESCNVQYEAERCASRLRAIGAAGFRAVLNYQQFYADRKHLYAYAEAARRARVQLIWPLKDEPWWRGSGLRAEYPELARDCRCASDAAFLDWVVRLVAPLPATWGYYVGDETSPAFALETATLGSRVRRIDPRHPRLFVSQGWSLGANLAPFRPAADVLGADSYPVGTSSPLTVVGDVAREVRRIARGRRSAMVLQAFSWGLYPGAGGEFDSVWPSRAEMRRMRDLAVREGRPQLLLWYSYFDIQRSSAPARRWRDLVAAAFG